MNLNDYRTVKSVKLTPLDPFVRETRIPCGAVIVTGPRKGKDCTHAARAISEVNGHAVPVCDYHERTTIVIHSDVR
jgi:methyl coenzyme M reductase subunit D